MLIDTHSHIYAEEFNEDRNEVITRAEAAGVGLILLPAIDKESYQRQEELTSSHPALFRQMMGLHPTSIVESYEEDLVLTRQLLFREPEKYIGVGEIGLDLYWDTTYKEQQTEALERQIAWAEELDKPVVLHLRSGKESDDNAYTEVFKLLEKHGSPRYKGIMHCFSGTLDDALRAIEMGFLIGIGGVVTYKKSTLPEIVQSIPLEKIVLETDSPYLAPVPHRGHRNESSFIVHVSRRIAELKGCDPDKVEEVTSHNALNLFAI